MKKILFLFFIIFFLIPFKNAEATSNHLIIDKYDHGDIAWHSEPTGVVGCQQGIHNVIGFYSYDGYPSETGTGWYKYWDDGIPVYTQYGDPNYKNNCTATGFSFDGLAESPLQDGTYGVYYFDGNIEWNQDDYTTVNSFTVVNGCYPAGTCTGGPLPTPTPTPTPLPNPSNTRVYVTNDGDNTISVIDGSSNNIIATIPVGQFPRGVVLLPNGSKAYVANFTHCCEAGNGTVSVINTLTNNVIATIPVGLNPGGKLAINPSGTRVYVPNFGGNSVSVINTQTDTVESTITVGSNPFSIAISQDGQKIYVANQNDNTVSVINAATNAVIDTIPTGGSDSNGVVINPDGSKIYTTNSGSKNVSVIDIATHSIIKTIPMSLGVYALALTPDGSKLYVTNNNCCGHGNGTVTVIDTSNDSVIKSIPVGGAPDLLSISGDGSRVYVPNSWTATSPSGNTVSVIDTATNTVIQTIIVGNNPFATATGVIPTSPPVNNAPSVGTITISPNPVTLNTAILASANFTDVDLLDTHTASIDWDGSGQQYPCTVTESNGSGTVNCSKPSGYAIANVYPVTITVSDVNLPGTSPVQYVSVYAPTQSSIFSAGQRFISPAGALPNSNTTGNVIFGLSYKYQGAMANEVRQFSIDFNQANLHFNATNVNALVINNGMATLTGTGTGTINNISGTYSFLVTGVDGAGIRIKIKDTNNNVVYDTQPGAPDNATPTTSINGQVIVH